MHNSYIILLQYIKYGCGSRCGSISIIQQVAGGSCGITAQTVGQFFQAQHDPPARLGKAVRTMEKPVM